MPAYATAEPAAQFLDTLPADRVRRYEQYFQTIKPVEPVDIFRRALFAFASVHTTWRSNCALYKSLHDLKWMDDARLLMLRLTDSGAGLHVNRAKFLMEFSARFWAHPEWYKKQSYEDWFEYRNRIDKNTKGLGLAKAAFFSELVYFEASEVSCMDVHLLKLFGIPAVTYSKSGANASYLRWCEQQWAGLCKERNLSPVTARWCYWDQKQKKPDSRYWSYVLEGPPTHADPEQLSLFTQEVLLGLVRLPERVSAIAA